MVCKKKRRSAFFSEESIHLQDKEFMQIKPYYFMIGSKVMEIKSYPLFNLLV